MKYREASDIKKSSGEIRSYYREKHSWGIREGTVRRWMERLPKDADIVELGAGSGRFAAELVEGGFRNLHLVDIDNYLECDLGPALRSFHALDICFEPLPFADESLDCALALQIFEHLENVWHPLREVHRVLKPGGMFVMTVPHIFGVRSKFQFALSGDVEGYRETNDHIAVLPRAVFRKLIRGKFEILETGYQRPFLRLPFVGRKLRLPRTPWFGRHFSPKVGYVMKKISAA